MQRYFTLQEAEELLSSLSIHLTQAQIAQRDAAAAESQIIQQKYKVAMAGGSVVNVNRAFALRDQQQHSIDRLTSILETVTSMGCVIQDVSQGLVDFPTFYEGKEVQLCWKLGEVSIEYWHTLEAGFAGRQMIDDHFRAHHQGSPTT